MGYVGVFPFSGVLVFGFAFLLLVSLPRTIHVFVEPYEMCVLLSLVGEILQLILNLIPLLGVTSSLLQYSSGSLRFGGFAFR